VKAIPGAERAQLGDLDVLVLNALWWRPHPTHLSIGEAVQTARDLGARRTYLTHLTHETGHRALAGQLPPGVLPAYDGLTVEIP
jgi:phosphoribosyl 1,2-cyclic phosphate phosphodiesterase